MQLADAFAEVSIGGRACMRHHVSSGRSAASSMVGVVWPFSPVVVYSFLQVFSPARVATWCALEVPWTRFVKSCGIRCAGGNDAALYNNCTSLQKRTFPGEPLTCQVFEPLQWIHAYFCRARI